MTAVILGGGVSGLSSAFYLLRNSANPFKKIILLEASDRVGGWVQTTRLDNAAIFEHGPRSVRVNINKPSGKNSLSLITELGLSGDLVYVNKSHPATKNRFIYKNKTLHQLPNSLKQIFLSSPLFTQPLYKTLWKEMKIPRGKEDDESIHSFICRRFGSEMAKNIADPFIRGIFAGDISKLSIKSCLPDIYEMEQKHGSVVNGMFSTKPAADTEVYALNDIRLAKLFKWSIWSLRNGLSQLTDTLESFLLTKEMVDIRKSTPCTKLEFNDNKVKVHTDNEVITADHVVSALPAQDLSSLIGTQHKALTDSLNRIHAVSCVVVNLEYKNYSPKFEGFGHLLPSSEDPSVLGVIYDSSTFKQHDTNKYISCRYTVMLGGAWYDHLVERLGDLKDSTIQKFVCQVIKDQLKINLEPSEVIVSVLKNCIPQYYVGHSKILNTVDSYIDNNNLPLSLVGASYKGVSVSDCILNAKLAVNKICSKLSSPTDKHHDTTQAA